MKGKAKILVVEDETAVAMMMVYLLTQAGIDAQTAWNAEKAMELARNETFDLVTLDIDLPGADGFEIFNRLKQLPHFQNTPAVFISGRTQMEIRQHAFDLGATDFIEKPFEAADFVSRIFACLERGRMASDVPDENPDANSERLCNAAQGNQ